MFGPTYPDNWKEMSSDEKFEFFKGLMLSTEHRKFDTEEAEQTYVRRAKRWLDVAENKIPDRVPNFMMGSPIMWDEAGITQKDTFYNSEKVAEAAIKFQEEFEPEFGTMAMTNGGEMLDLLGVNIMRWPGSSRPDALPDNTAFQYIEKEVMPPEDYEKLTRNPEGYLIRSFYGKIFDGLTGLSGLTNLFNAIEPAVVAGVVMNVGTGPIREALETIMKAADVAMANMGPAMAVGGQLAAKYGFPAIMGGMSFAPFDILGDTLRGTKGIMMDMYRRPDELLAALDAITPMAIEMAVGGSYASGVPFATMPLHKGADGFMSNEQFEKFYWPSFKALLEGIIDAGLIPMSFVEGSYNQRLDIIADSDLPKNKTMWWFDQTDMKAAHEKFGSWATIGGNIPASLLATGTPEEIDAACKEVIELCMPGGGYFLAPGCSPEQIPGENIHAFINSTKKYGVYDKEAVAA